MARVELTFHDDLGVFDALDPSLVTLVAPSFDFVPSVPHAKNRVGVPIGTSGVIEEMVA